MGLVGFDKKETSYGGSSARTIIDFTKREISVPFNVYSVAPLGMAAQTMIEVVCPDLCASAIWLDQTHADNAFRALAPNPLRNCCVFGNSCRYSDEYISFLNSGSVTLALDAGVLEEPTCQTNEKYQQLVDIPVVFLDLSFSSICESFDLFGMIVGESQRVGLLSDYIKIAQGIISDSFKSVSKIAFVPKQTRLLTDSNNLLYRDMILRCCCDCVVVDSCDASTYNQDVFAGCEYVLFEDADTFRSFISYASSSAYLDVDEFMASHKCVVPPALIHNWFGNTVFLQSIGGLWLSFVLNRISEEELIDMVIEFYGVFYGYNYTSKFIRNFIGYV
jgi:hypothetical protein